MTFMLSNNIECPECDTIFDVDFIFPPHVEVQQDITEDDIDATYREVPCPGCGRVWKGVWEGWSIHDDAG